MTVITAVRLVGGATAIGCDTASQVESGLHLQATTKLLHLGAGAILGSVGSAAVREWLRWRVHDGDVAPSGGEDRWLNQQLLAFRSTMRDDLDQVDGRALLPSYGLMATSRSLFLWDTTCTVVRVAGHFAAVGAGSSVAMGAMWACIRSPGSTTLLKHPPAADEIASSGVYAAIDLVDGCGGTAITVIVS